MARKQLRYAQGSTSGVGLNQVLVPDASVPDNHIVAVWRVVATLTTSLSFETTQGMALTPTFRGNFDTGLIAFAGNSMRFIETMDLPSQRGLRFDAGDAAGVLVTYTFEKVGAMSGLKTLEAINLDNVGTVGTQSTIIAAPGAGKKIVVWGLVGTWLGVVQFFSVGTPISPQWRATTDNKAMNLPVDGAPIFECAENEQLTYTLTVAATPNVGMRIFYSIEKA